MELVVWIGIDSWLLWINLWVNSQGGKLSYFCMETYTMGVADPVTYCSLSLWWTLIRHKAALLG